MTIIAIIKIRKHPEYREVIRKFYLLFTLKFLLSIFIFYIFYAPSLFFNPIISLFHYLGAIINLEGFFYLLTYLLVISIFLAVVFVAFKAYQKHKGKYFGSIQTLTRKTLYALFTLFLLAFVASAGIYPEAYRPMTDYLGDTIYTFSAGNIQVLKGDDIGNYKKIKSLGEFASSLSASIAETSQNISQSNQEYKQNLSEATGELKDSISKTTKDLKNKIEEDVAGSFPKTGGTITGDVTINEALTVDNTTYSKSIIPQSNSSYNLGSSDKTFQIAYIQKVSGLSTPVEDDDAATKKYVDDAIIASTLTFASPLYETATPNEIGLRYNATNLQLTGGTTLNTIQDIATTSTPTFGGMTLDGTLNSQAIIPLADSSYDLGSSANYFEDTYTERLYLNDSAYLDGGTNGIASLSGNLSIAGIDGDSIVSITGNIDGGNGINLTPAVNPNNFGTGIVGYVMPATGTWTTEKNAVGLDYGVFNLFSNIQGSKLSTVGLNVWGFGAYSGDPAYLKNVTSINVGHNIMAGPVYADNWYGVKINDVPSVTSLNNLYQLYIEKPTGGTNDYQQVLAGNGAGSGIWFNGTSSYARIYASANSTLDFAIGAASQTQLVDGIFRPTTDNDIDLGDVTHEFKDLYLAGTVYASAFVDDGTTLDVPDYVFEDDYQLMTMEELSVYIERNEHLPNVPSRDEIKENGMNFGSMLMNVLEKTEENTLYTIQNYEDIKGNETEISGSLITLSEIEEELSEIKKDLVDQEDLNAKLEAQIAELKKIIDQELNLAQIVLNTTEISEIKLALGIEYDRDEDGAIEAVNLGMTDLIGKLKSETLETGKLVINISDEDEATIGEGVINEGESSVTISQDNISEDSRIFVTPRLVTEQSLAVTDISDGEFTVEVAQEVVEEDGLPFDWWIVEVSE